MKVLMVILFLLISLTAFSTAQNQFSPPSLKDRNIAVGDMRYLASDQREAFSWTSSFAPKEKPEPSDWLANHREPGQSFDQFLRSRRNLFKPPRQKLYIQPLGKFPEETGTLLEDLKQYTNIFFQAEVEIQTPLEIDNAGLTTRKNPGTGQLQVLSTDVLKYMHRDLPADAYARIAVTMTDLYPADSWNFVFGQATYQQRVGVFSFARYGKPGTSQFMRRCIQIVSHETGHMFGFQHCIFYQCVMNGSNHLEESDKSPLALCPVCLRKLHTANHFSINKRYEAMRQYFVKHQLSTESEWVTARLKELDGN